MSIMRARSEHAKALVENLNEFSRKELELVRGTADRVEPLVSELERSTASYAGIIGGRVAAVWGVYGTSLVAGHGYLWMLTSTLAEESPFLFARHSQIVLKELGKSFPALHAFVAPEFTRSVRWLKWLGFEVGETEVFNGVRLRPAHWRV